jgi:hypothetical protein
MKSISDAQKLQPNIAYVGAKPALPNPEFQRSVLGAKAISAIESKRTIFESYRKRIKRKYIYDVCPSGPCRLESR